MSVSTHWAVDRLHLHLPSMLLKALPLSQPQNITANPATAAAPLQPLHWQNAPELIPFTEAFAHAGAWPEARRHSQKALELESLIQPMLCDNWARIAKDLLQANQVAQVQDALNCPARSP